MISMINCPLKARKRAKETSPRIKQEKSNKAKLAQE
jgi:hypothetical protein